MRNKQQSVVPPSPLGEEQLQPEGEQRPGPRVCKFGRVLAVVGDAGAALILERLNDPAWTLRGLARRLEDAGYRVDYSLISLHRSGLCICRSNNEQENSA